MNSFTINAVVVNQNGWWSVFCKELDISGFGDTENAAIEAFQRSLNSTIEARLRTPVPASDPTRTDAKSGGPKSVRRSGLGVSGQVVRTIPLLSGRLGAVAA
jgi:hypothetical protein